jgi:L,D-peptidoglycan transpeptidase YkuD (ErfK/YbiS/YcfS/YnhG family)
MKSTILLACLTASCCGIALAQRAAKLLSQSTQMLVVTTPDWNAVDGRMQRFERSSGDEPWQAVGEPVAIVVGHSGMGWGIGYMGSADGDKLAGEPVKKEGDGKSPAGVFSLGPAFGDAAQALPGTRLPYLELTPTIECVDDPQSAQYNRIVDRAKTDVDWKSSEHMRDVGEAYRWGVAVNHNGMVAGPDPNASHPGRGSCVFLHIWSGPGHGTAGCTAMPASEIESLLKWLDPKRKPLLVQMPRADYERLRGDWGFPALANAATN